MNKVTSLKGALTRVWNSGKYTPQGFCDYINKQWFPKHKTEINGYDWLCEIKPHIETLMMICPKGTQSVKKQPKKHKEWYVYFYFTKDDTENPIYIGKTYDIKNRLQQHINEDKKYERVEYILLCTFKTEKDALDFEAYYTRHLQPEWNISNKEAPSHLYKLPPQKVSFWFISENPSLQQMQQDKIKADFLKNQLVPHFQKIINSISAGSNQ